MKSLFKVALASFALFLACTETNEYEITVEYNHEYGMVSPEGTVKVEEGSAKTFTITPVEGGAIRQMIIDFDDVIDPVSEYTFSDVVGDHSLFVEFVGSNETMISAEDWNLEGWEYVFDYGGTTFTTDLFNNPLENDIPVCILDDIMTFDDDGTFTNKPGDISCNDDEQYGILGDGTWELSADKSKILLSVYGYEEVDEYEIRDLSSDIFILSTTVQLTVETTGKSLNLTQGEVIDAIMFYEFKAVE